MYDTEGPKGGSGFAQGVGNVIGLWFPPTALLCSALCGRGGTAPPVQGLNAMLPGQETKAGPGQSRNVAAQGPGCWRQTVNVYADAKDSGASASPGL